MKSEKLKEVTVLSCVFNRENFLGSGGYIAEEYGVLAKALWSGHYRHITPRDFKVFAHPWEGRGGDQGQSEPANDLKKVTSGNTVQN